MADQGTGVLDPDTGHQVFFPDHPDGSPATTTEINQGMSNIKDGTDTPPPQSWIQKNIITPVTQFAGKYNLDPVTSVKAFGGGFFKGEGLGQLMGGVPKEPTTDPNNSGPFAPTINQQDRVPTPTTPEQMMYKEKAPFSYLAGQFAGFGTDFAIASAATGGAIDALAPMAAKIPAFANLLKGIEGLKEVGTLSEQGVEAGSAVLKTPLTWGATGLAGSAASQKQETGTIDWGQAIKEMGAATGLGITAELTFGLVSKPLSEIGATSDLIANTSRKMVVSGAIAAGIVKANGGTDQESMFAAGLGAFGGLMTLHGDIEGVRQSVANEIINLKARYAAYETGEHPTSAYQKSMEQTQNNAEQIINEENQKLMENKPVPEEQRVGLTKPISDPVDARNHLVQFFSPRVLARMDDEHVTWLANQPVKELNAWSEQQKELDWEKAIQDDYLQKSRASILDDDAAKRRTGIAVDKTPVDMVANSKDRMTSLVAKTLNEVTSSKSGELKQTEGTNLKENLNKKEGIKGRFHGTGKPIDKLQDNTYSSQNYYGQGFYTTDDINIAKGYTKKGGKEPTLYEVKGGDKSNLYDMESKITPEIKDKLSKAFGEYKDILNESGNLREAFDNLREELSSEGYSADTIQEYYDAIRSNLEGIGYEGLRHIGGLKTGKSLHDVNIHWNPSKLEISKMDINKEVEQANNQEVQGGQEKVAKSSQDIADRLEKQGVAKADDIQKSTFESTSHKADAEKLSELMRTDPMRAQRIAIGEEDGGLKPHERQLLFDMVNDNNEKEMKSEITDENSRLGLKLSRSPINTERSLAAKTLGAAGFDNGFNEDGSIDADKLIKSLDKELSNRTSKDIATKISRDLKEGIEKVKKETVIKQSEWDAFIKKISC